MTAGRARPPTQEVTLAYQFVRTPVPIYVETDEEAEGWAERFMAQGTVGFDTETTGLHKLNARVKFFSLSDGENRICAPVRLLGHFVPILERDETVKPMTNAKFDRHMVANHGVLVRGPTPDTIVMDWLIDENRTGQHDLKSCAKDYLGLRMAPFKEVFGAAGAVEKEVQMMCRIHDTLEARDETEASDILVELRHAGGDEDVLHALQKLALSVRGGHVLTARQLLAIARKCDVLETRATGKASYISDFSVLLGGFPIPGPERARHEHLLSDRDLVEEAHVVLQRSLRSQIKLDMDPLEMLRLLVADYASLDAWATYELHDVLGAELAGIPLNDEGKSLLDYFWGTSVPFTQVLWNLERRGLGFDVAEAQALSKPMGKTIDKIEREVVSLAGRDVNLRSPTQLRDLFYSDDGHGNWVDPFGEPPARLTKGGSSGVKLPSTDEKTLQAWADRGEPLAGKILEHRELSKLKDTYLDGLPRFVDHRSRVHTDLKQTGAVTGRLSSVDPALQNIPVRGELGHRIRTLFVSGIFGDCNPAWCVPEVEHVVVIDLPEDFPMGFSVGDYDQLEVKVAAHVSGDQNMVQALRAGRDIHCQTSATITGIPYEDFVAAKKAKNPTPEQLELVDIRGSNKSALFGIFYGIGQVKLALQLKLPIVVTKMRHGRSRETSPEAQKVIDGVFQAYPGLKGTINDVKTECRECLYVRTLSGRYRRLPDIISSERGLAAQAERQSFNTVVQGGAADIVIAAMLACEADPDLRELGARMLLQVHDELIFERPEIPEIVEQVEARAKGLMENTTQLIVPLTVSLASGRSWGEAKK